MSFCGGRTDASDGAGWKHISPNGNYASSPDQVWEQLLLLGVTPTEMVALAGRIRSPSLMYKSGYMPTTWTTSPLILSNDYHTTLLEETWEIYNNTGNLQYKAVGKELYMLPADLALKWDPTFLAIVQTYASNLQV